MASVYYKWADDRHRQVERGGVGWGAQRLADAWLRGGRGSGAVHRAGGGRAAGAGGGARRGNDPITQLNSRGEAGMLEAQSPQLDSDAQRDLMAQCFSVFSSS